MLAHTYNYSTWEAEEIVGSRPTCDTRLYQLRKTNQKRTKFWQAFSKPKNITPSERHRDKGPMLYWGRIKWQEKLGAREKERSLLQNCLCLSTHTFLQNNYISSDRQWLRNFSTTNKIKPATDVMTVSDLTQKHLQQTKLEKECGDPEFSWVGRCSCLLATSMQCTL